MEKVTNENFDERVRGAIQPLMLVFHAPWCQASAQLLPDLERIDQAVKNHLLIALVDIEEDEELAEPYRIVSLPTILCVYRGRIKKRLVGTRPYPELAAEVNAFLEECVRIAKQG